MTTSDEITEAEGGSVDAPVSEVASPVREGARPRVVGEVEEMALPTPSEDVVPAVEPVLIGVPSVPEEPEGPVFNLLGTNLPTPSEDGSSDAGSSDSSGGTGADLGIALHGDDFAGIE